MSMRLKLERRLSRRWWGSENKMTDVRRSATMVPSQGSLFTNFEDVQLTDEERVYLNAAAMGDIGIVRQSVEENDEKTLNLNCVDYMGRNALHLAIDSEKMDVIEILTDNLTFTCIEEALLHAISKGASKIVKVIIEHPNFMAGEDRLKQMGAGDAFFRTEEKSQFSPDVTPLILAAHYNNHEIIQMFLSRNHTIKKPHTISCNCTNCVTKQNYDSLKRSRSRFNAYRALASPAYMALSSPDPIMTTFELRQEMVRLSEVEKEFKNEYLSLLEKCMNFAYELMDLCRGTQEVEAVLSEGGLPEEMDVSRDPLARLKMAIRYEEKKFVAHPNCQQHMTSIWYGSEMSFLQSVSWPRKILYGLLFIPLIPILSVIFILAPNNKIGAVMKCPVIKFMTHTMSHLCFLMLLTAATFRLTETAFSISTTEEFNDQRYITLSHTDKIENILKERLRPANELLTRVQLCIVFWILGLLWMESKQLYYSGARDYLMENYNFVDFIVLSLYIASYVLRFLTNFAVKDADIYFNGTSRAREMLQNEDFAQFNKFMDDIKNKSHSPKNYFMEASRFQWHSDDPEIVSDVLFAVANVISFARTTYLMPAFEVLGPLQISLGRMIGDITRFLVLFLLVLFSFMVGLHNLYWYYGARQIKMTVNTNVIQLPAAEAFQGLKQTFYSLFWSMFGQGSINDIYIRHPRTSGMSQCVMYQGDRNKIICTDESSDLLSLDKHSDIEESSGTRSTSIVEFVGLYMFGTYHVVIVIVLINMLIAMMSHSFEVIQGDCDVEWKFARTKLWMNYVDEGSTLPVPFNMIPAPKSFFYIWLCYRDLFRTKDDHTDVEQNKRKTFMKKRREIVCKSLSLKAEETSYTDIMQRLVRRYLFKLERAKDETAAKDIQGVQSESVEIVEPAPPDYPPPDPPNKIPFMTPPIQEEPEHDKSPHVRFSQPTDIAQRKKSGSRMTSRRSSLTPPSPSTVINIPQLDGIQRSQKLLDVRLQHLQSSSKENSKLADDIEFIRRLMGENQKALFNIIQALSNIQGEIVNLAQCLSPASSSPAVNPTPVANHKTSTSQSIKRSIDEESKF